MKHKFNGTWPALVTPLDPDGKVNTSVIKDLVDYLLDKKVGGFYLCGATGQGIFLSVPERKRVLETVTHHIQDRVPVIVHTGSMVMHDAIDLTQHACENGASGISSIIPPLYKGDSVYPYFEAVASAAQNLPLLPYLYGAGEGLLHKLKQIPNVIGTKYTGPDMDELKRIIDIGGDEWIVFSGMDEHCVFCLMMGVSGNVGSSVNVLAGSYKKIHEYCASGNYDEGIALQLKINEVIKIFKFYGYPGALKEALRLLGMDCGIPVPPGLPVTKDKVKELHTKLDAIDFMSLA